MVSQSLWLSAQCRWSAIFFMKNISPRMLALVHMKCEKVHKKCFGQKMGWSIFELDMRNEIKNFWQIKIFHLRKHFFKNWKIGNPLRHISWWFKLIIICFHQSSLKALIIFPLKYISLFMQPEIPTLIARIKINNLLRI